MNHQSAGNAGVTDLAKRVDGRVLTSADEAYDTARTGFQLGARREPALIVEATGTADVSAAVRYAAEHDLPATIQSTGHGVPGPTEGGVLITTGRMDDVRVDPDRRTAWIGGGSRWDQVIELADPHGLAPLSGSLPNVSAAGYTLGGGLGLLARTFGYAADHVRRLEVVTADGEPRTVDPDREPDLFWALRGGFGNFAVVTGMEIDLVAVPRMYAGSLGFSGDQAAEVINAWHEWTASVPDTMTSAIGMIAFPDAPPFPEHLRGQVNCSIVLSFLGDGAEGKALIEPLRQLGPVTDSVREMAYSESAVVFDDPSDPHGFRGDAHPLDALDPDAARQTVELLRSDRSLFGVVGLRHLGGGLARPPASGSAVGHRDAAFLLSALSVYDGTHAGAAAIDELVDAVRAPWASHVLGRALPFTFGRKLTIEEVAAGYDADAFTRLRSIKAAYDGDWRFRGVHDIPPAT